MPESKATYYTSFGSAMMEHEQKHHVGKRRDIKPLNMHPEPDTKHRAMGAHPGNLRQGG